MNTERFVGSLTADETIELAKACLEEMSDTDQIQLIRELCLEDQDFCEELIADIEGLAS